MKIKRFDIQGVVLYLHVLNPIVWIVILIFLLYSIFFSWWKRKRDGDYWVLLYDKDGIRRAKIELLNGFIGMFINTAWMNLRLTRAYLRFLEEKWLPYYPKGDWRREKSIKDEYQYYLNVKNGKFKNK